jgi:hypothetical protein
MLLGQIFIAIVCVLFIIGGMCIIIDFLAEPPMMNHKEFREMIDAKKLEQESEVLLNGVFDE